jgi:hypothetical protein
MIYDQGMTVLVHYFFFGGVTFGEAELLVLCCLGGGCTAATRNRSL